MKKQTPCPPVIKQIIYAGLVAYLLLLAGGRVGWAQDTTPWLDHFDGGAGPSGGWEKAGKWANGSPFANIWLPGHVEVPYDSTYVRLRLDDKDDGGAPCHDNGNCQDDASGVYYDYASGEYRTKTFFGYGCYEANLEAASGEGVISSFFLFRNDYPYKRIPEIDWEFFGDAHDSDDDDYLHAHTDFGDGLDAGCSADDDCAYHPEEICLNFDPTTDFHTYGIRWAPNPNGGDATNTSLVQWYVDGAFKREAIVKFTETYGRCNDDNHECVKDGMIAILNLWPSDGGWHDIPGTSIGPGIFTYPGTPIYAYYDWVEYKSLDNCTFATAPTAAAVAVGIDDTSLHMAWAPAAVNKRYQVHRSTAPYFTPDASTLRGEPDEVCTTTITYDDADAVGSPASNHFYYVLSFNAAGDQVQSNHVGEFDFALVVGS